MALSQNVVVNFLTKFDKKGLDRATKELKGFDKTVAKSRRALKAGLFAGAIAAGFGLLNSEIIEQNSFHISIFKYFDDILQ